MISNKISILLFVTAITGCKTGMTDRLINKVSQDCGNIEKPICNLSLREVTPFQWDRLYFFGAWITSDSISKVTGIHYHGNGVRDDYRRMIFTLNNEIVYEEDFESFDYNNSVINFLEIPDSLMNTKPHFLTPINAVFLVKKVKIEGSCKDCYSYNLSIVK
ncbi:MAG TPA: hypothetical protein VF629_12295 [Hymenobacter sp.]|jgi:hypothetical protein|uniref:hypothetical protein n=1 Tax=Hymenobacter sp. TaxID=1898978 RepID=UPI002EDA820F